MLTIFKYREQVQAELAERQQMLIDNFTTLLKVCSCLLIDIILIILLLF